MQEEALSVNTDLLFRANLGCRSRHVFGALRLRPPIAEHTQAEGELLRRCARDASCAVEIGVSEGGSAWQVRQVINPTGTLHLIDPYERNPLHGLNMARIVAHRLVARVERGDVEWIRQTSQEAAIGWAKAIDFLFLDGDHSPEAVDADWRFWSQHVKPGGTVALHDAPTFAGGWTSADDGPVRLVEDLKRSSMEWQIFDEVDSTVALRRAPH
jgi:predicted O-methyltransferase YrrM